MEQKHIQNIKRLLLGSLAIQAAVAVYQAVQYILLIQDPFLAESGYSSPFTAAGFIFQQLFWIGIMFALVVFSLKKMKSENEYERLIPAIAFICMLGSWAAPLCLIGLYLILTKSPVTKTWIDEIRDQ